MKKIFSLLLTISALVGVLCFSCSAEEPNALDGYIGMDWQGCGILKNTEKGVIYFEKERDVQYAELVIDLSALAEKPRALSFSFMAGNLYSLPQKNQRDIGRVTLTISDKSDALATYSTDDIDSNRYYQQYVLGGENPIEVPENAEKINININATWTSGECTDVYYKNFVLNFFDEYTVPSKEKFETSVSESNVESDGFDVTTATSTEPSKEMPEPIMSGSFVVIDTLDMTDMTTEPSEANRMFIAMLVAIAAIVIFIIINRVFRYFFPKKKVDEKKLVQQKPEKAPKQRYKKEQRFFAVTKADIERGDLNKISEPLTLLIDRRMDKFELERVSEKLTEPQKTLAAVMLYIGEVQSGGHESFFCKASEDFVKLVGEALTEVGLDAICVIYKRACAESGAEMTEKLSALDEELYASYRTENVNEKLNVFISQHTEDFLFDGFIEIKLPT